METNKSNTHKVKSKQVNQHTICDRLGQSHKEKIALTVTVPATSPPGHYSMDGTFNADI